MNANIKYKGQGEKLKDEKYMGNKKEVLLFYLLMIAVIGWFVVAETVYPSERIKASRPENLTYRGTFTWQRDQ